MIRVQIAEFGIVQKTLAQANVTFYVMDDNGSKTSVLATLYQDATGNAERSNPQTLNDNGQLSSLCYVDTAIVAEISGINDKTERSIKKITQNPLQFALPVTSSGVKATSTLDVATQTAIFAQQASDDADQTALDRVQTGLDRIKTTADAIQTASDKSSAENAATAVQNALSSIAFPDVLNISSTNSPYVVTASNSQNQISVDTSAGDVIVNVSPSLAEPFSIRLKKETPNENTLTINLSGTETFKDGTTSKVISSVGGIDLTLDTSTSPDTWHTANFGAVSGENKNQQFNGVLGDTSVTITNLPRPSSSASLIVQMGGVIQLPGDYSYDPDTGIIIFDQPSYDDNVAAYWSAGSIAIGVTADGTVSYDKLSSGLFITASTIAVASNSALSSRIVRADVLKDYVASALDGAGREVLLDTQIASTDAEVNFANVFDDTVYKSYRIEFTNAKLSANDRLQATFESASGEETTNSHYSSNASFSTFPPQVDNGGVGYIQLTRAGGGGQELAGGSRSFSGEIKIYNTTGVGDAHVNSEIVGDQSGNYYGMFYAGGGFEGGVAVTGFNIKTFGAGTITGDFRIYGIKG